MTKIYETDALYVDEAQLIKRLNLPKDFHSSTFVRLQETADFPKPEAEFGNRRYYPAIVAWLDHLFGLGDRRPYFVKDDIEAWKRYPTSKKKRRKSVWGG